MVSATFICKAVDVLKEGPERYREGGGEVVSVNTIITFIFFLNGINVLEDVCISSTEKEGKLTVKT